MENREMSVEEMIAAGCPWEQIQARITKLQKEQKEKESAAKAQAQRAELKAAQIKVAKDKFVASFADWMIAEGLLEESDKAEFSQVIEETSVGLMEKLKMEYVIASMLLGK